MFLSSSLEGGGYCMVLNKEVDWIFGNSNTTKISRGYLVCDKCSGYYKLKNEELPTDFSGCECGNTLRFVENTNYLSKIPEITQFYDEYEELQKIVDIVKTKAQKRKKFLENLHKRIKAQEKLLNEIRHERLMEVKHDKWSLWDVLDEESLNFDIKDQKAIIEEINQQQNKLMGIVKEKRENEVTKNTVNGYFLKISVLVVLVIILSVLAVYAIK